MTPQQREYEQQRLVWGELLRVLTEHKAPRVDIERARWRMRHAERCAERTTTVEAA